MIDPVYQGIVRDFDAAANAERLLDFLERELDGRLFVGTTRELPA